MSHEWKEQAYQAVEAQRFAEARQLLEGGLQDSPDDVEAIDLLGFVCFFLDDFPASLRWNRRALEIDPQHAYALKGLGLCLHRLQRSEEGLESLALANAIDPSFLDAWHDRAVVLFELERPDEARAVLEEALQQNPTPAAQAFFAPFLRHLATAAGKKA